MDKEIRKQASEYPLLDEIIYQCQIMMNGLILKDETRADENETVESLRQSDIYANIIRGTYNFTMFKYDILLLKRIPTLSRRDCLTYARDNSLIPDSIKPQLTELAKNRFLDNYEELNNYYRMLNGLPNVGDPGIYLTREDLDTITVNFENDGNPIHKMTNDQILILEAFGIIDKYKSMYKDTLDDNGDLKCKYLWHLGEKKIDPNFARRAQKFSVLYIPPVETTEVYNKFVERLEINRVYFLQTSYSDAYKYRNKYYDRIMMIMIIVQAFDDMIIRAPEYIIRRDVFDLRTIQYIFDSCGVEFFPDIPLKYQKRLVKNLNRLIKYKSCDKNLIDISKLFGFDNIQLFKYWLMKVPLFNDNGEYRNDVIEDPKTGDDIDDVDNNYELTFLKVPFENSSFDECVRDKRNWKKYDDIAGEDIYWQGFYTKEFVKHTISERIFNARITKYISVSAIYSVAEMSFQLAYFINMILYSDIDLTMVKLQVPELNSKTEFELVDLMICLYSLMYLYNETQDNIIYDPVQALAIKGFNFEANMELITSDLANKGLTPEDVGISGFKNPNTILSFDQLVEVYRSNKKVYKYLQEAMYNANNRREWDIYHDLYEALFITKCNFGYFNKYGNNGKPPKTYREVLGNKCAPLYTIIKKCESITKKSERQLEISKYINYITENIYLYIDRDEFKYIFQNIPTVSLDYIKEYLFEVIMFFKSHKVDLIHTNNMYIFDDIYENRIPVIDDMIYNVSEEFPEYIKSDDFKHFLNHITYMSKCVPKDKMYMDIYWFKPLIPNEFIPVFDKIVNLLITIVYDDTISIEDKLESFIHTYEWEEYIRNTDNMRSNTKITFKDSCLIEDYVYLD